jgi:hypothetical protein
MQNVRAKRRNVNHQTRSIKDSAAERNSKQKEKRRDIKASRKKECKQEE